MRRHIPLATSLALLLCGSCHLDPTPQERPRSVSWSPSKGGIAPTPSAAANPTVTASPPTVTASLPTVTASLPTVTASLPTVTASPPTPSDKALEARPTGDANALPCHLLAVGDSLTDPKSHGGGYLRVIEDRCHCTTHNLGRGGDMVNQMRRRLLAHLSEGQTRYTHVLVFGGVNDLYSDVTAHRTLAKIEKDLTGMYEAARAHGARVIAVTVTPWGGFGRYFTPERGETTQELNRWIAASTRQGLTDFSVDAYARLSCGTPARLCERYAAPFRDGLHFGPLGQQRLGEAVVESLGSGRCPIRPDAGSAQGTGGDQTEEASSSSQSGYKSQAP